MLGFSREMAPYIGVHWRNGPLVWGSLGKWPFTLEFIGEMALYFWVQWRNPPFMFGFGEGLALYIGVQGRNGSLFGLMEKWLFLWDWARIGPLHCILREKWPIMLGFSGKLLLYFEVQLRNGPSRWVCWRIGPLY